MEELGVGHGHVAVIPHAAGVEFIPNMVHLAVQRAFHQPAGNAHLHQQELVGFGDTFAHGFAIHQGAVGILIVGSQAVIGDIFLEPAVDALCFLQGGLAAIQREPAQDHADLPGQLPPVAGAQGIGGHNGPIPLPVALKMAQLGMLQQDLVQRPVDQLHGIGRALDLTAHIFQTVVQRPVKIGGDRLGHLRRGLGGGHGGGGRLTAEFKGFVTQTDGIAAAQDPVLHRRQPLVVDVGMVHGIGIYDDIMAVFPQNLGVGTADGGVVRNVIIHISAFSAQAENRLVDLNMLAGLGAEQKRAVLLLERIHRGSSFWLFLCLFYRFFREKSRMQMKSQRIYEAQVVPEASVWYASCRKEVRP